MELKWSRGGHIENLSIVLIAPLWNWNEGWELCDGCRTPGSNRTFMELKFVWVVGNASLVAVLIAPLWNWNFRLLAYHKIANDVLIAPLWNWNSSFKEQEIHCVVVLIAPLWNWNFRYNSPWIESDDRSNRTFIELKCVNRGYSYLA